MKLKSYHKVVSLFLGIGALSLGSVQAQRFDHLIKDGCTVLTTAQTWVGGLPGEANFLGSGVASGTAGSASDSESVALTSFNQPSNFVLLGVDFNATGTVDSELNVMASSSGTSVNVDGTVDFTWSDDAGLLAGANSNQNWAINGTYSSSSFSNFVTLDSEFQWSVNHNEAFTLSSVSDSSLNGWYGSGNISNFSLDVVFDPTDYASSQPYADVGAVGVIPETRIEGFSGGLVFHYIDADCLRAVPEPSSALLGVIAGGIFALRRRRK